MDQAFQREVTIRSLLKAKGYCFDPESQYWAREWTTNGGQETVLEVAVKTEDGEWNKLMMTPSGHIFYAEAIGESIS